MALAPRPDSSGAAPAQGFIIVQIGNEQLERICTEAIIPAIRECGLDAKRVDKHNEGGLLKSEIIRFIEDAQIIVADLTNERPNVYLEIGFTMGVDKFRNLILTVREDHFPESPNHKRGGPRVHFDLAGYDILRWSPDAIPTFKAELVKRIRRRLAMLPGPATGTVWDEEWIAAQRADAIIGLTQRGRTGFMEVRFALHPPKINKTQAELDSAAREAEIRTFGWPIAVYMTKEGMRPRPRTDGIVPRSFRRRSSPSITGPCGGTAISILPARCSRTSAEPRELNSFSTRGSCGSPRRSCTACGCTPAWGWIDQRR